MESRTQVIVIVGAGSIGLWTAYHLANCYGKRVQVIVLEVLDGAFKATSGTNTGCLHFAYPREQNDLIPLGQYSFNQWDHLSQSSDFVKETGFKPHSFFSAKPGDGRDQVGVPNWIQLNEDWDISRTPLGQRTATM